MVAFVEDKTGLQPGTGIRAAPYDFRLAPRSNPDYFGRLAQLVEETHALNGNTSVVLMAHSMGCLYSLYFLAQQPAAWKAQYLHAYMPFSGVWGGTAKIMRVLASGDNEGIPFVKPISVRGEQRSYETNPWLMPGWCWGELLFALEICNVFASFDRPPSESESTVFCGSHKNQPL